MHVCVCVCMCVCVCACVCVCVCVRERERERERGERERESRLTEINHSKHHLVFLLSCQQSRRGYQRWNAHAWMRQAYFVTEVPSVCVCVWSLCLSSKSLGLAMNQSQPDLFLFFFFFLSLAAALNRGKKKEKRMWLKGINPDLWVLNPHPGFQGKVWKFIYMVD